MNAPRDDVPVPRWLLADATIKLKRYAETVDQCVKADDLEFAHYVPDIQETVQLLRDLLLSSSKMAKP